MNSIKAFLIRRKMKKGGLSFNRDNLLKSRPVRNSLIKWEKSESDEVSLIVPQKDTLWVKVVTKIFMLPRSRVVQLDEVGSCLWGMCFGNNTKEKINLAFFTK